MSPLPDPDRLRVAQSILGVTFRDATLLRRALTHPSHSQGAEEHYERLEFLGDALLGFYMADRLFRDAAQLPEGRMSKVRASFVSGESLATLAEDLGLEAAILMGPSAAHDAGAARSALSDCFEALVAAVYLDRGTGEAFAFLDRVFPPGLLARTIEEDSSDDPKNLLQEHTQARDGSLPDYRIVSVEGPPHDRIFTAEVYVEGALSGAGSGPSKKAAERAAAETALERLSATS